MKHALYLTLACLSLAGPGLSTTVTFAWSRNDVSLTKPAENLYPNGFLMELNTLGANTENSLDVSAVTPLGQN
jgi:hypothetical protein